MKHSLFPISSLLLSNALLLLGHGLLLTLLPIVASQLGFTSLEIALTGSAYFLGFVSGCLLTPHILRRVGHIRSFAVLAVIYLVLILLLSYLEGFAVWLLARFIIGAAISGLYMIIESWLNERADASNRGAILSFYSMLSLLMIMLSQQLFTLGNNEYDILFVGAAILVALSIIPVSLTLSLAPAPVEDTKVSFSKVWKHSQIAMVGVIIIGFVTGAFWSLAPVFASQSNFTDGQLAMFMSASVLGGACCQIPIGKFSDRFDRRIVLFYLAFIGALVSAAMVAAAHYLPNFAVWPASVLAFFWGGTCMTMYAICLAHANDNAQAKDFVPIGSGMLITFGISSAIGGPIASGVMSYVGALGLYAYMAVFLALFALIIMVRRTTHELPDKVADHDTFQPSAGMTTPMAFSLDPRTEHLEDELKASKEV
ncbi:MFS transporter [Glaciecola sp. SC05]|uniref:MFS transporter n=1 Tax=Glaciecola sp. SC05 TaxID=1987355 RepID=UPI0035272E4F